MSADASDDGESQTIAVAHSLNGRAHSPVDGQDDSKLSRKREREVSIEPSTPKVEETVILGSERSDAKTPAKKNRLRLDATEEEGDVSPPLSTSPPHETKIRQISRGVEDINWRNGRQTSSDEPTGQTELVAENSATWEAQTISTDLLEDDSGSDFVIVDLEQSSADSAIEKAPTGALVSEAVPADPSASQIDSSSVEETCDFQALEQDEYARQVSTEVAPVKSGPESVKRPRDDDEKDANPRQNKRPSPPPDAGVSVAGSSTTTKSETSNASPKLSGFMAYASTSSPFANVKGPNIFGGNSKSSTSPFSTSQAPSPPLFSGFGAGANKPSTSFNDPSPPSSATSMKRTGFEAFASSASPFATAAVASSSKSRFRSTSPSGKSKSPPRRAVNMNNPFSSYAGAGKSAFAVPASKRARAGSPGGSGRSSAERNTTVSVLDAPSVEEDAEEEEEDEARETTFGERLRAGKDEEDAERSDEENGKVELTEQEWVTGEEDEETVYQVRGKLYHLSAQNQWKERGVGTLKLNVRRADGGGARLVMRKEAVYSLILNVALFKGMSCFIAQDPRYLRFSVIEAGVTTHYNLRVANAKLAQDLLNEINLNIPGA